MTQIDTSQRVLMAFRGAWECLSNFYPSPIIASDGITYPTGEHAFQAWKTPEIDVRRRIAALPTPGEAKGAGRQLALRSDWEQVKKQVMLRLVLTKFTQNGELGRILCSSGRDVLVEGNTWHDNYWGDCLCDGRKSCDAAGQNYLGQILMAVRLVLQED